MANKTAPAIFDNTAIDIDVRSFMTDSLLWFQHHWLRILIALGIAAAIVIVLLAIRRVGTSLCNRDQPGKIGWWKVAGRTISRTNLFFMVMTAAQATQAIADPPPIVSTTILNLFTVAVVLQAAIWVRELILGAVEHRTGSDSPASDALGSAIGIIRLLVTFAVFAIALVVVLDNLGINVTGLIAGLGVGGIAIGLAAQGIFADLFAALAIVFDAPFRRGDTINYDNTTGTVENIGLKSTRLRAASGEERIIANKQLLDKEIRNFTQREYRRITIAMGLVYQTPQETLEALPAMLERIVDQCGHRFAYAGFVGFGDSSINFELEFDSMDSGFAAFHAARHQVGLAIAKEFAAEGIEFAYPTQTSFTAAPDGKLIYPYAEVQAVKRVDLRDDET